MAKDQMRYTQSWGAVAPSLVLLTRQRSSAARTFKKLETILEEGSENCSRLGPGHGQRGLLVGFPVVMSVVVSFYFLRYRSSSP